MKVTKSGNDIKVDMSFDEWVRTGSKQGWIKKASAGLEKTASVVRRYSPEVNDMLKTASAGDVHDLADLPHVIMLNSGSDDCFATSLATALGGNKSIPKPRIVQLDVSQAESRGPEYLKKAVASVVSAKDTVWKVLSADAPSMSLFKEMADRSGAMHKTNTWVVFQPQD